MTHHQTPRETKKEKEIDAFSPLIELLNTMNPEKMASFLDALDSIKPGASTVTPRENPDFEVQLPTPGMNDGSVTYQNCVITFVPDGYCGGDIFSVESNDQEIYLRLDTTESEENRQAKRDLPDLWNPRTMLHTYANVSHEATVRRIELLEHTDTNLQAIVNTWHPTPEDNPRPLTTQEKKQINDWLEQMQNTLHGLHQRHYALTDVTLKTLGLIDQGLVFMDTTSLTSSVSKQTPRITKAYQPPEFSGAFNKNYNAFHGSLYSVALIGCALLSGQDNIQKLDQHINTQDEIGKMILKKIKRWSDPNPKARVQEQKTRRHPIYMAAMVLLVTLASLCAVSGVASALGTGLIFFSVVTPLALYGAVLVGLLIAGVMIIAFDQAISLHEEHQATMHPTTQQRAPNIEASTQQTDASRHDATLQKLMDMKEPEPPHPQNKTPLKSQKD